LLWTNTPQYLLPFLLKLLPWRWRPLFVLKSRYLFTKPQGVSFQKTIRYYLCMEPRKFITTFPKTNLCSLPLPIVLMWVTIKKGKSYPCNRPWRPMGSWDVEASTFSLENRLTDGGEVVSLMRRPPFTPQEDSWYSFLLEAESTPGP
jgi:hypothetical protein